MSPVLTRSRPASVRVPRSAIAATGAVIVALLVFAALFALVRGPDFIDHVTIDNRTATDQRVDLVGPDGGLIALGVVDAHSSARIEGIVDPGDPLAVRVSHAGRTLATVPMTRDKLAANGWRVVLPASLEDGVSTGQ
jgi:hypothetical protein